MTLSDLIARLEKEDPSHVVPLGFANPHSYRGDYSHLAFAPMRPCSVASMLNAARSALGNTYQGWKGGDYEMSEWTTVYLAERGDCGEEIGPTLLDFMLSAPSPRDEAREGEERTVAVLRELQREIEDQAARYGTAAHNPIGAENTRTNRVKLTFLSCGMNKASEFIEQRIRSLSSSLGTEGR
jgi:hypothetical protein